MDLPSIEQRAKKPLDRGHLAASVSMTSGARINPLRGAVVIGALGVVFGDIGTSPIYTFRECLKAAGDAGNEPVLGLLSLVFWAIMIVVTIKYVCFVMRADNDGEGGIIALGGLAASAEPAEWRRRWLVLIGIVAHHPVVFGFRLRQCQPAVFLDRP